MPDLFRLRPALALAIALALMPTAGPLACDVPGEAQISQFDGDRMTGFEAARSRGLAEALMGEDSAERAVVSSLFAPGDTPTASMSDGAYRCRTIKLGGITPLVTYPYFDCAVSESGTVIEKLTGSQRFKGQLLQSDGALFYFGALHYGDEQPMAYGTLEERSQVGCLTRVNGKPVRYRLEMPFPRFESTHDVIELVPAR